eukprot:2896704-Rhodomonas_salina.1
MPVQVSLGRLGPERMMSATSQHPNVCRASYSGHSRFLIPAISTSSSAWMSPTHVASCAACLNTMQSRVVSSSLLASPPYARCSFSAARRGRFTTPRLSSRLCSALESPPTARHADVGTLPRHAARSARRP